MAAPTLSMTFEVAGSMASVPMSPQSSDSAQRPETNRLRVSPTSRLISFGGPYWVVSLRKSSALPKASLLTSGFMSLRVEEHALAGALRLDHAAGDRGDEPVGLGVALLGDARAVVGRAVAVHVLAVQRLGDGDVVVERLRRLQTARLEHVGAVVDHVEVAIQGQHVDLAAVLLREVAEERPTSSSCRSLSAATRLLRSSRNPPAM